MLPAPLLLALLAQTAPAAPAEPGAPASTAATATPAITPDTSRGWLPLFNGRDFTNWYTFRNADGKNNDPQGIFKVENSEMRFLGLDDTTRNQPHGYIGTNAEYRNYRLRLEYRWGDKKVPPRADAQRDAGILYHVYGADTVWPRGVECQIQELDTGDVFFTGNNPRPIADATIRPPQGPQRGAPVYQPAGTLTAITGSRLIHSARYDHLRGWNWVEVYIDEDEAVHVVNGRVNAALTRMRIAGSDAPLTQGRIALQSEGAEVFYRNIELKPLFTTTGGPEYRVLVFSRTTAGVYRHASIAAGVAAVRRLGERNGFAVEATEDPAAFNDENLKKFAAVVFLSSSGDVFNAEQEAAFQRYIRAGGGFVGVHAASTTEYDWPWFGQLVGAYFKDHPPGTPQATVRVADPTHPSTNSLPLTWTRNDEWYNFRTDPRANVRVLLTVDETTYTGGTMGEGHPIAWYQEFEGGRSWYTALGHAPESFADPLVLLHLLGGIQYAAGASSLPPAAATKLAAATDSGAWAAAAGEAPKWTTTAKGALEGTAESGPLRSTAEFGDARLHVEFRVTPSPPETPENQRARGAVVLQGRYSLIVADSFDQPQYGRNDGGALAGLRNPSVNASQPSDTWQSYDIWFRAARWNGDAKTANATVTVYQNGTLIHDAVELPAASAGAAPEAAAPGPLVLEVGGRPVQFRNLWFQPLAPAAP